MDTTTEEKIQKIKELIKECNDMGISVHFGKSLSLEEMNYFYKHVKDHIVIEYHNSMTYETIISRLSSKIKENKDIITICNFRKLEEYYNTEIKNKSISKETSLMNFILDWAKIMVSELRSNDEKSLLSKWDRLRMEYSKKYNLDI
jgi:hypothetical protein